MSFYQTVLNRLTKASSPWRSLSQHLAGFIVVAVTLSFLAESFLVRLDAGLPREALALTEKRDVWSKHRGLYDLVYVGDSRTYLGISPKDIEQYSRLRGYNLGFWANWLPTQVALLRDVAEELPQGKVIVWSIAHDTFMRRPGEVNTIYPLGFGTALRLWQSGFEYGALRENVLRFIPGLTLFVARDRLRADMNVRLSKRKDSSAAATSRDIYTDDGALIRQELIKEHYRAQQREAAQDLSFLDRFEPDPLYTALFMTTLQWLRQRGINVIINEMELAPYHYKRGRSGDAFRRFMKEFRTGLERDGVPYVRVQFESYPDDYYFDFTHFNEDGVKAYARDFSAAVIDALDALKKEAQDAVQ